MQKGAHEKPVSQASDPWKDSETRASLKGVRSWAANERIHLKSIKRVVKFSGSFSHLGRKLEVYSTEKRIQRRSSLRITADGRERHTAKNKDMNESLHTVRASGHFSGL